MKGAIFKAVIAAVMISASSVVTNAIPLRGYSLLAKGAGQCPVDVLSCSQEASGVDTCCTPSLGNFVFEQQWVPGFGPADAFTIHGLFPNSCNGGRGPANGCDPSRSSDDVEGALKAFGDQKLLQDMDTFWPSDKGDNNVFWSHEWSKHGTCVSTLDAKCFGTQSKQNQDMHDFFQQVLALREQFDLFAALKSNGISPGDKVDTAAVESALEKAFGVSTSIECTRGAISAVQMSFNVRGQSDFKPIDSPSKGSCRGSVLFPSK